MRMNLIICLILAVALILCPVAAFGSNTSVKVIKSTEATETTEEITVTADEEEYISVMSSSTKKIERIGMREYIIGCVAAEMSANYHTEALKAQAVASYTYAKKTCEQNWKYKDPSLGEADITDSPATHQGYLDRAERKEKWGEKSDEYEAKITAAVDEVIGIYLSYDSETALAVYHAISAGSTQSAKSLWGSSIPYLTSVESPGDRLSPDYVSVLEFTQPEFKKLAKKCGAKLDGDSEKWLGKTEKTEEGYVTGIILGSEKISGSKVRDVFGLRSLCFDVEYTNGKFVFTCYGYGHGVGMSQYGADYLARQGFSWQEILGHYYPGTEIIFVQA